jgi:DNA-binding NtrC family response regulator
MKSKTNIAIIDDDLRLETHPLVNTLKRLYENVILLTTPEEGVSYIEQNLDSRTIVILDYKFATDAVTGKDVLNSIRTKSKIIPVIIWTANGDQINDFSDFINNGAYAFLGKGSYSDVVNKVKEADNSIENSLEGALEEWISLQESEKLDSPYLITAGSNKYTLRDLLSEVRLQTPFGKELEKNLLMLTIGQLIRKKQNL